MVTTEKLKHVVNRVIYRMPDRYGHLAREIRQSRARTILEIGVWDGEHARMMIRTALGQHAPDHITYHGLDLFEDACDESLSVGDKRPPAREVVARKLRPLVQQGVTVHLHKGNSTELLPALVPSLPSMDLIFIDGGHQWETVRTDWEHARRLMGPRSILLFDDYSDPTTVSALKIGVNRVVDSIDRSLYTVAHLAPIDSFKQDWGAQRVGLVKVTHRAGIASR